MNRRKLLTLSLVGSLTGCGFKLRGRSDLPFKKLLLVSSDSSMLTQELRRTLRANQIVMVKQASEAEAILTIRNELRQRNILTFSATGRVREVELRYIVSFDVRTPQGLEWLPAADISLKRDVTYSDDQVLAKESEELLLYRDMQSDVVQQMLRRLSVLKPEPKPAQPNAGDTKVY